jgi:hypothetical protein
MPEERISYLEPIESNEPKKDISPLENQRNSQEKKVAPEFQSEKAAESKSENESLYQRLLVSIPQTSAPTDDEAIEKDANAVSLQIDADSKVVQLVELAVTKGVVHAIKVARKLDDFYVLDKMHNDLANKFHASLKERGLIKEV